jgi:nucleotide-binding universal stress UspA family protein
VSEHTPQRILVGISCTPDAASGIAIAAADVASVAQAMWLAEKTGAELRLFHVIDFIDRELAVGSEVVRVIRDGLDASMAKLCHDAEARGVQASYGFGSGKAWYELLREAHAWSAELLVISPRRETLSFGQRIVHGSSARRVMRKAACPVWVVDPARPVGVRRILALVDGSEISRAVMRSAAALADASGAERVVLRCLDYPEDIALRRQVDAQRALRRHHDDVRQRALAQLEQLAAEAGGGWTVEQSDDWVVRVAPQLIARHDIDLAVLGCVSAVGLAGVLLGSTAEQLLERAAVSAWIVRPEQWRSPVDFGS